MKRRPNRTVYFMLLALLLIALAFFILSMVKKNQPAIEANNITAREAGIAAVENEQNQEKNAEKAKLYDSAEQYRAKHDYKMAAENYELSIGYKDSTEKLAELNKYALEYVAEESEGLIAVKGKEGYGFINGKGETVIPCVYSDVHSFSEGLAAVQMNNKWGYVNKSGELIIPYTWIEVSDFHEGLAAVSYDGNTWRYIDQNGVEVISRLYESYDAVYEIRKAGDFSEGRCVVTFYDPNSYHDDSLYDFTTWVIDKKGTCIADLGRKYSVTQTYSNGYLLCQSSIYRESYYIDLEGNWSQRFFIGDSFKEGMALIEDHNGECYYWDANMNKVFLADYNTSSFSEGLAYIGNKYIDKNGQTVLQFDDNLQLGDFKDGYAKVWNKDKYFNGAGLIDKSGRLVVPCEWQDITYAGDDVLLTSAYTTDNGSGIPSLSAISLDGSVYVEPNENTDHIMYQDGVFLLFCLDGYLYLMDRDGNYLN